MYKGLGCPSESLKKTPKGYPDPVLWASLEFCFLYISLRSTNSKVTSAVIRVRFNP